MEYRSLLQKHAQAGDKFRLEELTLHTSFDVIVKATFGHSLNAKTEGSPVLDHWEAMTRAFASTRQSYNSLRTFLNMREVKAERKKLDTILADMVKRRFDSVVQDKKDLTDRKGLCIMDLILRDYVNESRQSGQETLDPAFLEIAVTQVKTLMVAGAGTTSDVICFAMMM